MAKKVKVTKWSKKKKPSTHGRDGKGKFTKGNHCGTGANDHKATIDSKKLKAAFAAAISEQDIRDIVLGLAEKAKKGDVLAAREVFDRLWGKAPQAITGPGGEPITMKIISYACLHGEPK